jgi:electron transport complex protein RnfC
MKMRLHHFFGGLHLKGHKSESTAEPVLPAPIPDEIILPLRQHIGKAAEAVVQVGDHVLKGQMIAKATEYVSAPVHASTSGEISAIETRPIPHPSGLSDICIVLKPDGKDEWIPLHSVDDYTQLDPSALRNIIRDAGIVGLGGAGFPTFIKLNPGPNRQVETLILNGAECEPYITCDAILMQEQPRRIIDGLLIMRHALKAQQCIIALEDINKVALTLLKNSLLEHESDFIQIIQIPTLYPTGGEKQLIKVLTGKEIPQHKLPIDTGVICHNVATAIAVLDVVESGKPLIERIVTVTGKTMGAPRNFKVAIGTPFSHMLNLAQWNKSLTGQIIMGGPMMGFEVKSPDVPVIKTTNCILTLPEKKVTPVMPCIRCGQCATVCPAQLLPQQLYWQARAKDFDRVQDYNLFDCIECGACAFVCPSQIPLVQYYRFAKTEIWALEREKQKSDIARDRHEFREFRLERKKKEDEERKLRKKAMLKKTQDKNINETDAKQAAINAAVERVKAKRESQANIRKNTTNLTEQQKEAIATVELRRQHLLEKSSSDTTPAKESGK